MSDDLTSPPTLCDDSIASGGFRLTRQRREVYGTLLEKRDHPCAVQVFTRVQQKMPSISLATVYNCLETLTHCGLVRQVNFDRGPSRFCANTHHHAHFICTQCGAVHDVELPEAAELERVWRLPEDYVVTQYDFSLRGLCRACSPTGSVVPAPVSDPTKK